MNGILKYGWAACGMLLAITSTGFEVIEARYGTGKHWNNVMEKVLDALRPDGTLEITVSNEIFGDPAPGITKSLRVVVREGGKEIQYDADEGGVLQINRHGTPEQMGDRELLLRTILGSYERGEKSVRIAPRIYRVGASAARNSHLTFSGMKDFEIDATGATFIFLDHTRRGITFENCRNVTFRGASLYREVPPFSQGTIVALDRQQGIVDVEVHKGYPENLTTDIGFQRTPVLNAFLQDGRLKKRVPDLHIARIEALQGRRFRFHLRRKPLEKEIEIAVGDYAAWRRQIIYDGEVNVMDCAEMKITGMTIRNAINLGVLERRGDGGNYFNYTVTWGEPPAGATQRPLLSSAADGFHSGDVRKGPTLENCVFDGTHDDGVNIHGAISRLEKLDGDTVVIKTGHLREPRVGDRFHFYDANCVFIGDAAVKHAREERLTITIQFDRQVPAASASLANYDACGNGYTIRNCVTRNHRGIGFRLRPGEGIIENCLMEDIHEGGIVVTPEFQTFPEGTYARNLVIRNNVLRRTTLTGIWWPTAAMAVCSYQEGRDGWQFVPLPGGHRNILIEGNRFEENDGPNLFLSSAIGVVVRNNVFQRPMEQYARYGYADNSSLVLVTEAEQVAFSGNAILQPGSFMKRIVNASPTASVTGAQSGFQVKK